MDGYALYAGEVETGQVVSFPIDPRAIGGGSHTIKAAAQKQDYITAIQIYSFSTPAVAFPSGELGVQLQDEQGNPVFPQTSAALVQGIKGKSAGMNLQELYAGAFPTPDPSAAQLRKVTLSQTDLEAGVSPLATGELYFVYE